MSAVGSFTPAATSGQGYVSQLLQHLGVSNHTASGFQLLVVRPVEIVAVVLIAWLFGRLGARAASRAVNRMQGRAARRGEGRRTGPRVATIGGVLASIWKVLVWVVAALIVLGTLGVNLTPLIAGATVIGAALGFGAQTLVRDFLSGFFIVSEDQYGVGDTVTIGDTTGVVEDLSLRVTRLRDVDGMVWYVSNGEIRKVGNASIQWSRAIVDILVPLGSDVAAATAAIEEEATGFAEDDRWASSCVEGPEVWGVQAMDGTGVTIRVAVRTRPLQHSRVAAALRGRINHRLFRDGVLRPG
jgi:moderate conductance mechanosensitive channel